MKARVLIAVALAWGLVACASVTPDKPVRATLYDFGPGPTSVSAPATTQAAIVLPDLESSTALESSALLYRLGYADAYQLHPYAHARWSATPPQLVRLRLRELLGRDRAVLDPTEFAALARSSGTMPRTLRIELEEFSQVFDSPTQSFGVVRLRATVMDNTPGGERLIGQRVFAQRQSAPTADAAGGVRAITAATDAIAQDVSAWIATLR